MDELIKLLDQYDTPLEHVIINGEVKRRVKGTNLSTGEKYEPASVWRGNKSFGFIKRLIENDKVDLYKAGIDELPALNGLDYNSIECKTDRLTMILSIKDKPVDFIISILKEDNEKAINEAKAIKEKIDEISEKINEYVAEQEKLWDNYLATAGNIHPEKDAMSINEKMFCVDKLLRDIRGNWTDPFDRARIASDLCLDIGSPKFITLARTISSREGEDGRYFRTSFPYGYEGIPHGLSNNYYDKSKECQEVLDKFLTFPSFDDKED